MDVVFFEDQTLHIQSKSEIPSCTLDFPVTKDLALIREIQGHGIDVDEYDDAIDDDAKIIFHMTRMMIFLYFYNKNKRLEGLLDQDSLLQDIVHTSA